MRDRKTLATSIALALATAAVLWAHHGPDTVVLDDAGPEARRAPVEFPHKLHVENVDRCDTCHHTQEGLTAGPDIEVQTCASCHLEPDEGVPGIREMGMRNNPYHLSCVNCHREREKGPTACNDCHPRQ
jgi:hypothetical protein